MEDVYSIKRKLETYKKMQQMSEAMKLAAITSYSNLLKKTNALRKYTQELNKTTADFIQATYKDADPNQIKRSLPIFFSNPKSERSLVIILGSTKELGSGYFGALKTIIPKAITPSKTNPADFILIGKSAKRALSFQEFDPLHHKIIDEKTEFKTQGIPELAKETTKFIIRNNKHYKECIIINLRFRNLLAHDKNIKTITPIEENAGIIENMNSNCSEEIMFQEKLSDLGENIAKRLIYLSLIYEMYESVTAENAARYITMDKAVTNADTLIDEMTIKMNKARQIMITKQIAEISCYTDL